MQLLALQMVLPHAPVPVPVAFAVASHATCIRICTAPAASALPALLHAPRPRSIADARSRVPHTHRADRTIKKKPRGRRNPPANEAVTKWLIIETLESATLEEIVQFAFCVCDA